MRRDCIDGFRRSAGLLSPASGAERAEDFFDSNGVKIRYVTEGTGEAVVLIHGFAASAEMWNAMLPELAKDHRVIALDCRGHGKSDKPHDPKLHGRETIEDVVRLLDHLKIDKAHIVGYSMGAEIAGHLLVLHRHRLLSVTLGGGGPVFEPTGESRAGRVGGGIAGGRKRHRPRDHFVRGSRGETDLTPEIGDAISKMILGNQDQKALAASVRGAITFEVTEAQLKENRVPVLVIHGSNDGRGGTQATGADRRTVGRPTPGHRRRRSPEHAGPAPISKSRAIIYRVTWRGEENRPIMVLVRSFLPRRQPNTLDCWHSVR